MKTPLEKIIVRQPENILKYLDSPFNIIRFGEPFCLRYARMAWTPEAIKIAVEQILLSKKIPEFQTLFVPYSSEHVDYIKTCVKVLEDTSSINLVVGDIGIFTVRYSGEKIASHVLKIKNEMDISLLRDFGVTEVGIDLDSWRNTRKMRNFISAAHRSGMKVEIMTGNIPLFLGWKCYSRSLVGNDCGNACRKNGIPLFPLLEKEAVFYARGKVIYSSKAYSSQDIWDDLCGDTEDCLPDSFCNYEVVNDM